MGTDFVEEYNGYLALSKEEKACAGPDIPQYLWSSGTFVSKLLRLHRLPISSTQRTSMIYSGTCLIRLLCNPKLGIIQLKTVEQTLFICETYSIIRKTLQSIIRRRFSSPLSKFILHNP